MQDRIEIHQTVINGEHKTLHRCYGCLRLMWFATGSVQDNNGFIPIEKTINHLPGCSLRKD